VAHGRSAFCPSCEERRDTFWPEEDMRAVAQPSTSYLCAMVRNIWCGVSHSSFYVCVYCPQDIHKTFTCVFIVHKTSFKFSRACLLSTRLVRVYCPQDLFCLLSHGTRSCLLSCIVYCPMDACQSAGSVSSIHYKSHRAWWWSIQGV
jgi:hypothetical protein